MFDFLATLLAWFYSIWPSYGMAIVFLTLSIMVILTPLTLKGTRSMMVMQALQPEMKKLQQRYKDDRQKLNEELLSFYKENNINPLGGCLPLLIQMPVFLVLYRVLRGLTRPLPYGYLREHLTGVKVGGFDPSYISHDSALYNALHGSKDMVSWGIDLSQSATQALRDSFTGALPYLVLIAGVVITSYVQQKQVAGRNPAAQQQMNPQQQMLLRIMPVFFAFISLNLPAALVVYFFISNLYRVGQQEFISRRIYRPANAQGGVLEVAAREVSKTKDEPAREPVKSGGFFGRLLGDAAPRLGPGGRSGNGSDSDTAGKAPSRAGARGNGGRPPPAKSTTRPTPGRTTPAGGGPQPRARKKKKRK